MRRRSDARRWAAVVASALAAWAGTCGAGCTVWAMPLPVGDYDASASEAATLSADIELRCDQAGVRLSLALGPSAASGSVADRRMRHLVRSDTLRYNLYQDAYATRLWGDSDATMWSGVAASGPTVVRIFARIEPGQDVWVGEYADEVVLTVLP